MALVPFNRRSRRIPLAENGPAVDLYQLTQSLQAQGVRAPMLFRFLPIVGHRIEKLNVGARRSQPAAWAGPQRPRHAAPAGSCAAECERGMQLQHEIRARRAARNLRAGCLPSCARPL